MAKAKNKPLKKHPKKTKSHQKGTSRKWSVKTVSTFPPEGLYTKHAKTIARVMATKKISPKGIGADIFAVTIERAVAEC